MLLICYFEIDLNTQKKHLQPIMGALRFNYRRLTQKEHPL
ncbi:hypothetical protein GCHA_0330 [Paraglaciecola chathamensis S18K6]|uniref:Transposase n=1 Tax=Paraglaciecola chathamensis S18K6 TaxID=1127672 RepID=A0AAV3UTR6_9ALTE|nr:hypothetical protein GCHA_0330 [Paraglaciecola chathamensis S18K6]